MSGLGGVQLLDHGTRLNYLTWGDRGQVDSIAGRAQSVASGEEEYHQARALMDVAHLLRMIGGEYERIGSRIQGAGRG